MKVTQQTLYIALAVAIAAGYYFYSQLAPKTTTPV